MPDEKKFTEFNPAKFGDPTMLPDDNDDAAEWQRSNREFWEKNPMRYDFSKEVGAAEFSPAFFQEIDSRFFGVVKEFMSWKQIPFEKYIPFNDLREKSVLEIGVGNGSHAQLIASRVGSYTGVDLTEYAIKSTKIRFELNHIEGQLQQADAEQLEFADRSFDFVWSWGVIHHTSNTKKVIQQIHRVLMDDGRATVMVYYRGWWNYYIVGFLIHGLVRGKLFKYRSLHKVMQSETDGAIARYYHPGSWRQLVGDHFRIDKMQVEGAKTDLVPLPAGQFKSALMRLIPNVVGAFMTRNLRMGSLFVVEMTKK